MNTFFFLIPLSLVIFQSETEQPKVSEYLDLNTRLLLASAYSKNTVLFDRLIATGIEFQLVGSYGETPLHAAASLGNLDVLKKLIQMGYDPLGKDALGRTPCMLAVQSKKSKATVFLLKQGAKAKERDRRGTTLLMWSCIRKDLNTIKILINRGADVNAKDPKGRTALDFVRFDLEAMDITRFLVSLGAKKGQHSRKQGDLRHLTLKAQRKTLNTIKKTAGYKWGNPLGLKNKRAGDLLLTGRILFLEKQVTLAEEILGKAKALESAPCAPCLIFRAELAAQKRLYEESNEYIRNLIDYGIRPYPLDELRFSLGKLAFSHSDYDFATEYLNALPESSFKDLNYYLGCLADEGNQMEKARLYLQKYLTIYPHDTYEKDALERMEGLKPSILPVFSKAGRRLDMELFNDVWVYFDFWSAKNDDGRRRSKDLNKLKKALKKAPFIIVGVNIDADDNEARDILVSFLGDWPQYFDPELKCFGKKYGVPGAPSALLISPGGQSTHVFSAKELEKPKKILKYIRKTLK